jgi:hypothetical protein
MEQEEVGVLIFLTRIRKSSVRAVPHAKEELMHLVLTGSSIRRKRHESVMNNAMNMGFAAGRNKKSEQADNKYTSTMLSSSLRSVRSSIML